MPAPRASFAFTTSGLMPPLDGVGLGARMKVNPPIRAGAIDGLWRAIEAGEVALVSSDHSSWPIYNKLTTSIFDAGCRRARR
jgi:dihydroorotase-like cyclic amidohydrolase